MAAKYTKFTEMDDTWRRPEQTACELEARTINGLGLMGTLEAGGLTAVVNWDYKPWAFSVKT